MASNLIYVSLKLASIYVVTSVRTASPSVFLIEPGIASETTTGKDDVTNGLFLPFNRSLQAGNGGNNYQSDPVYIGQLMLF